MRVKLSRRARWAVPATAVVVTGGIVAGLRIPTAQAAPDLPVKTPAQLLASIGSDAKVPPLTGTVVESTSLGLPRLPQAGNPNSVASLLTGPHTVKVYYQDAKHFRLAVPTTASETDVIRNGNTLWLWQSSQDSVTKFTVPDLKGKHPLAKLPNGPVLTPQQAAGQVLKAVGKTTVVSVESNVMVAGEPAYQLVLAPKDHRSLIGKVTIAIDGRYGVPLRVQVFAKGAPAPAIQIGYTDLSFTAPDPANFTFTPPPGATVDNVNLGNQAGKSQVGTQPNAAGFGTYGKSWLTVVAIPQSDLTGSLGNVGGFSKTSHGTPSPQHPVYAPAGSAGLGISSQDVLGALFGAAKPVHGAWGSGTLLQTGLFSMLITNGEVYLGAVEPSVLYAAVGHTS